MACSKARMQWAMEPVPKILPNNDYHVDKINQFSRKISLICICCKKLLKKPKVLPCFHTFCSTCLIRQKLATDIIICFDCLDESKTKCLEALLPNILVINCLIVIERNLSLICFHCKEANSLVAVCLDCENFLCWECSLLEDCKRFMTNMNYFSHDKKTINELIPVHYNCIYHYDRNCKFYCTVCDVPMCDQCIQGEIHKAHEFQELTNLSPRMTNAINNLIEEKLREMFNVYAHLKEYLFLIEQQFESVNQQIFSLTGVSCSGNEDEIKKWLIILHESHFKAISNIHKQVACIKKNICALNRISLFQEGLEKFVSFEQKLFFKKPIETILNAINPLQIDHICQLNKKYFISESSKILNHVEKNFNFPFSNCCGELHQDNHFLGDLVKQKLVYLNLNLLAQTASGNLNNDYHQDNYFISYGNMNQLNSSTLLRETVHSKKTNDSFQGKNYETNVVQPLDRSVLVVKSKLFNNPVFLQRKTIRYVLRFGSTGKGDGKFSELCGIAVSNKKELIIPDSNNHKIQVFNINGKHLLSFGHDTTKTSVPNLVAVNRNNGNIVISERAPSHQIKVYDRFGKFLYKFGENILLHPRAIAVDSEGRLVVVESRIKKVTIFLNDGELYHRFDCASVEFPISVTVNDENEIFIADNKEHCIKVFDYCGMPLRSIGCRGITDFPIAIRISHGGDVVIADNHDFLKFTVYKQNGYLVTGYSSKIKQNQCLDFAFIDKNTLAITCMDNQVYIYNYPSCNFR